MSTESDVNNAIIVSKDILILKFHLNVEGDHVLEILEHLRDSAEEDDEENTATTDEGPIQRSKFTRLFSITMRQKSTAWFHNEQVTIFLEFLLKV